MKPFRTRTEIEDVTNEIVAQTGSQAEQISLFSLAGIDKLSEDDILDRIEDIDSQSTLLRWRLWYALRKKYPSDREFGQRIAELKSTRSICAAGPQVINREMHCGRFCEQYKINNINTIGIKKSVFYMLSSPKNKDISHKLFNKVKHLDLSIVKAERVIEQLRAVATVEKQPDIQTPVKMEYDEPEAGKQLVFTANNEEYIPAVIEQVGQDVEDELDHHERVNPVTLSFQNGVHTVSYNEQFSRQQEPETTLYINDVKVTAPVPVEEVKLSDFSDDEIFLELINRKSDASYDQIKSDFMLFAERYDKSFAELSKLFSDLAKSSAKMCS